jgi:hypothetical protein
MMGELFEGFKTLYTGIDHISGKRGISFKEGY